MRSSQPHSRIDCVAAICTGLDTYQNIGTDIVDAVLEEIRLGLEQNDFTQDQRRLAHIKLIAELYTFKMASSQVIFDTLYLLVTHGLNDYRLEQMRLKKEMEENPITRFLNRPLNDEQSKPYAENIEWTDTFRIQSVCLLLETCGKYLRQLIFNPFCFSKYVWKMCTVL